METQAAKPSKKSQGLERTPRNIRLDNEEWAIFKTKLGTEWLRQQIQAVRGTTTQIDQ